MEKASIQKRALSLLLCFVSIVGTSARPLAALEFKAFSDGVPVRGIVLPIPLGENQGVASSWELPSAPPELGTVPNSPNEKKGTVPFSRAATLSTPREKFAPAISEKAKSPAILQLLSFHNDIARTAGESSVELGDRGFDFANFYSDFVDELNAKFASSEYKGNRALFLHDVEQSRFHKTKAGMGELEAKLIDGHVCVRFASKRGTRPVIAVLVNAPLAANEGLDPLRVAQPAPIEKSKFQMDPPLGSRRLDTYRSRLLINRRVHPLDLIVKGSFGDPHRAVLILDHLSGAALASPALGDARAPFLKRGLRWWKHWIKGTIEPIRYGDVVRGSLSSSLQFGLAYSMAALSQYIRPSADPFIWGPAIAAGLFAFLLAVFSESYAAFVQRGDNRSWESTKRLAVSALLLYPLCVMQAHGDWRVILSWQANMMVWLVGLGDRYLSTVMNVVPKIHQKYYMKPWFFPVRMKAPFRDFLAWLTRRASFKNATIKGVTMTWEALANARFVVKFPCLFLDPVLMRYTHGLPVATLLLWGLAAPFELFNYHQVKKLAQENPRVQEELAVLEARRGRWGKALRNIFKK